MLDVHPQLFPQEDSQPPPIFFTPGSVISRSGLLIYLVVLEIYQGSNVGTLPSRSSARVPPLQSFT